MSNTIYPARTVTTITVLTPGSPAAAGEQHISWDTNQGTQPSDADIIALAQQMRASGDFASVDITREVTNGELVDLDAETPAFTL